MRVQCARVLALSAAIGMCSAGASAQITIPTVTIGDLGNAPDTIVMIDGTSGYGSVAYEYNIGMYEVTNAQYAAFLNAKAKSDPFGLYNNTAFAGGMAGMYGGIARSGSPGSYTYSTISGRADHPVNYVSFWDACRFVNWLHNGQGNGDTETGAYTLGGITNPVNTSVNRNAGWKWALTSENEWYKAAYHQPASEGGDRDNYWLYPTQSNGIGIFFANYADNGIHNTTPVGSYPAYYYGAFDMGGNVSEWNDTITFGSYRGVRGGAFTDDSSTLRSVSREYVSFPTVESYAIGFRVSQAIGLPSCPADYNGSGDAGDILDFLDFFDDFGACDGQAAPCGQLGNPDVNGDTSIDVLDFLDFLDAFGQGC